MHCRAKMAPEIIVEARIARFPPGHVRICTPSFGLMASVAIGVVPQRRELANSTGEESGSNDTDLAGRCLSQASIRGKPRSWTDLVDSLASARQRRKIRRLYSRILRAWGAIHSTILGDVSQLKAAWVDEKCGSADESNFCVRGALPRPFTAVGPEYAPQLEPPIGCALARERQLRGSRGDTVLHYASERSGPARRTGVCRRWRSPAASLSRRIGDDQRYHSRLRDVACVTD